MSYIDSQDVEKKRAFLERISTMYYINEKSQQEIAEQFGIGRSSVARFLGEAKQAGIVQIRINSTKTEQFRNSELEYQLMKRYKLRDCAVLRNDVAGATDEVVPEYIDRIIPQKGILGIGGGRTMYQLAKRAWMISKRPELSVIQLTGSLGSIPETSVTKLWAESLDAKGIYISAPLLADDPQNKKFIEENSMVREALGRLKEVDTSIISIGATDLNTRMRYLAHFQDINVEEVYKKCVGDAVFHFFDKNGRFCLEEVSQRVIGVSHSDYLKIPNKIVIAYGAQKTQAIRGAIQGGMVNILVTDCELARGLLE